MKTTIGQVDNSEDSGSVFDIEYTDYDPNSQSSPSMAIRRLLCAVVERAFHDIIGNDNRLSEEAMEWFLVEKQQEATDGSLRLEFTSLQSICDIVGLDMTSIQTKVRNILEGKRFQKLNTKVEETFIFQEFLGQV